MALVDEMMVSARAGRGGNGVVRWLHEKGKEFGGPSGGNGGKGGDIVFRAVRDMNVLSKYRGMREFYAKNGEIGGSKNKTGASAPAFVIDVPVGSIITSESREPAELLREGDLHRALAGGRGGLGNAHYKSSTNQYPTEFTAGEQGESGIFTIVLQIIADAGIIGLANAGKTSLLNALTNASAKVGAYPFTTLEPNLGAYFGYVLADIPGLIEGAAKGKGLGHAFLKHIARTKVLIHCVSIDQDEPIKAYETVRSELEEYDTALSRKAEIVLLTKTDRRDAEAIASLSDIFRAKNIEVLPMSIHDTESVKRAGDAITHFLERQGSVTIAA